ncbi:hypothetical protein [Arenibacter certesii]|uniref:Uncharacterized protein n=1 Tax=Arenibacter certesii TaxID=228955 RepID=A0A918MHU2_9FLAO|nr:hypothetical protein [Arenibacter certesii]GGW27009.1 hypothetical protein GCM10007383_10410 [Arenibacter certesii]
MFKNIFFTFLTGLGFMYTINAQQDCSLGIGVSNMDTVVQVFQLNVEQKSKLEEFQVAVGVEAKLLDEERTDLFEKHPQSTPEELKALEVKHKVIEEKIKALFYRYDRKLLALFNEKQYQRYLSLCREVSRQPIEKPVN